MTDEPHTLRDRLIDAAGGDEEAVDRQVAHMIRGSSKIAGIQIPKTRCPAWQAYEAKHGRSEDAHADD